MTFPVVRTRPIIWQLLFIFAGTSWLLAPGLNRYLSDRTTLISQYESSGQPYALLFRLGDLLAAMLLVWAALRYSRRKPKRLPMLLLLVVSVGMLLDPVFTISCHVNGPTCQESLSSTFIVHAIESTMTGLALFAIAVYDAKVRQKLVSVGFVGFQIAYGLLFITQYAEQQQFNTASQYLYQYIGIIWLAWFVRDYVFESTASKLTRRLTVFVRYSVAIWVLLNSLVTIILSLTDINLLGKAQNLYFSRDTAWLAQHGVIVGVIMLYLSRHLLRGERRARQIILAIIGLEALKYAVLTPNWAFALLYSLSFCLLFVMVDAFRRGSIPLTWQVRAKDLAYLAGTLLVASLLILAILDRDSRAARIADRSFGHFTDYALHSDKFRHTHKESVLLADTTTAFLIASSGAILWVLFKPYKLPNQDREGTLKIRSLLEQYSNSSEDYFKLWPTDKQYYWGMGVAGFIAYRVVGSVAFALADPISKPGDRQKLIEQFMDFAQTRRFIVCFLPVTEDSLALYEGFSVIQIGASAIVDINHFLVETSEDKWWRWKKNRAIRQGYEYDVGRPPHRTVFLKELELLSDSWLSANDRQERGFALGYFDQAYLQQCNIHYLKDQSGKMVAFANQLPALNIHATATIDLMRYGADATDVMPYLLANVITSLGDEDFKYFDLGFVPFAETKGSLQAIAGAFSSRRFSAKGLQQFKNKFKPEWQKIYLVYEGDLADLAVITLNVEAVMEKP